MYRLSAKQISKYIKANTSKECLELVSYLEKNLDIALSYKNELLKIVLLTNSDNLEQILRSISYLRREAMKPLKEGLECEGYTASVYKANQYTDMKDIIKTAFKEQNKQYKFRLS